jgi:hypothetical protein
MTNDPVTVSSLNDIEFVLSTIIDRLNGLYAAKYADPSDTERKAERQQIWDRIDHLYNYVEIVSTDVARTRFLTTITELP